MRSVLIIFAALLCMLGAASAAKAAEYIVNSTGDQVDEAVGSNSCETAVGTCTLRAAIEESNASIGVNDTIKFGESFNGQIGDTIELGTSLPTIADRVIIRGSPSPLQCETDYVGLLGPCVGVNGPSNGTAFRLAAERVVLNGFAISGAKTAVEAVAAPGLQAWNDWFGVKLDGSAGPLETGISLDQNSNGALLGSSSSDARNIFAHNTDVGIDIDGADWTGVRGNGFGVLPDGGTAAANGTNIEITDAATGDNRVARGNWIGWTPSAEQFASPVCDGPCNVISGATESGIDLVGDEPDEKPASGSTRILGNYIGLNAFGTAGIPNALQGVLIGNAENVVIGGLRPEDRNMINGGANGVLAYPGAGSLDIEGNWIGTDPSGTRTLAPPTSAGIAIEGGYQVGITGNRISMLSGTAIDQGAQEAVVRSNAIGEGVNGENLPGGSIGIHLFGNCFICNLVYDNSVANSAEYGVLIENGRNHVYGNRIEGSGGTGIQIQEPPPWGLALRNLIGGDRAGEENTISRSAGVAVEIAHVTEWGVTERNEVARNNGALNGGPFIALVNGANGGILPPSLSGSNQSGASGEGAEPEAVIRVFRKGTGSPGEIASFLAETTADKSGAWTVTYPSPVPGGTIIAASQTTEDGTSEFAFSTTMSEPSGGAGEGGGSSGAPGGEVVENLPPPDRDRTPPQTFIFKGPSKVSHSKTARFSFGSSEPSSVFRCKLDGGPIRTCRSPRTFRHLRAGKHVFKVWATDASGNEDGSPATWRFRVHLR